VLNRVILVTLLAFLLELLDWWLHEGLRPVPPARTRGDMPGVLWIRASAEVRRAFGMGPGP
jgi:hypothetical protein